MLAYLVLSAAAGTLTLSDAFRTYVRKNVVGHGTSLDVQDALQLGTKLAWPQLQLDVSYAPQFTALDVIGPFPTTGVWLHDAAFGLELRRPRYVLSLTQTAMVGQRDFAQARALTEPAGGDASASTDLQLLPTVRVLPVAAEETSARATYLLSRRWRSTLGASLGISGGSSTEARRFLPRERTAAVDASLEHAWSRRVEIGAELAGSQIETSNGYEHWLTSMLETWSVHWTRNSDFELGAGMSFQHSDGPYGAPNATWVPVGLASLGHTQELGNGRLHIQCEAGYRPDVNVVLGVLQNRLYATALAGWTVQRLSLDLTISAARTFAANSPATARVLNASLALHYTALHWLDTELGGRVTQQRFGDASPVGLRWGLWSLYAGVTARAPEVRF